MEIDDDAMNAEVPNMILQPLVENSIHHGINKKVDGGVITIRAHRQSNRVLIEIADDGRVSPSDNYGGWGIGLSNTNARLEQLYGVDFTFDIHPTAAGTSVQFDIPFRAVQEPVLQESAAP
jgi:two-component system LytT family sensor kinase/two-component system sensor histidine kinase LytS